MKNLAHKYHAGQPRKGGDIPYIVHPQAVVQNLLDWGVEADSDIIKIGWGHDLLEDTNVTAGEVLAASNKNVLSAIQKLTCPETMEKNIYIRQVADCGRLDVLLVKISDRISNTRDFIDYKGKLHAYQYLHKADPVFEALQRFADNMIVQNALKAWRELDELLRSEAEHAAIRGCLIGGAVGDALGAPVEFMTREQILRKYGQNGVEDYVEFPDGTGAITDDTQMALFTAEGLLRAAVRGREKGICAPAGVMGFAYLRWLKTQGITPRCPEEHISGGWLINESKLFQSRAPGMTCINALTEYSGRNSANNDSKGCGTVMRMAPVGLFMDIEDAYEYGCQFSAITHGHPTGISAGGAFAMLLCCLRKGKSLEESLDYLEDFLADKKEALETLDALKKARQAENISELGEGWVAEETLAISVFCALKYTWDFAAGVKAAVNITGDSDSTGSMTGNILGILNGESAIPENWRRNLREYDIVSQIADDIHARCELDEDGHVTHDWWEKYPGY